MKTRSLLLQALLCIGCMAFAMAPNQAQAGGLFLTDHGTLRLGRGFAFVAGTNDPTALWYNPAGLAFSGQQLIFDATVTFLQADYTRVDSGGNELPTVDANAMPLPIPNLGYSHPFGDFTLGVSAFAPNASLLRWPRAIDAGGNRCASANDPGCTAAPQRYSLYSLEGSAFGTIAAGLSWKPTDNFSIGASAMLLVGQFVGETAISGCDGFVCTQPENPNEDGVARFTAPIVNPGFSFGAIYAHRYFRVGASVSWFPLAIRGKAKLDVRLPNSPLYDEATIDGDGADLTLDLPFIARVGVEARPTDRLRIEAALVYERWSAQDAARIEANDIWIRNARAIGDYQVGDIEIPRQMNDVYSVRLGGEYDAHERVTVRAGLNYENSSFSDQYLTALTLDSDKFVVSLGASVRVSDSVFIDVSYGHIFLANRNVTDSQVPQPNPIRPPRANGVPPTQGGEATIGNGRYAMEADMIGIGLRWRPGAGSLSSSNDEAPYEENAETEDEEPVEDEVLDAPAETSTETAATSDGPAWYEQGVSEDASGGTAADNPEAEEEVEEAPVADRDGDGVPDELDRCPRRGRPGRVNRRGCPSLRRSR